MHIYPCREREKEKMNKREELKGSTGRTKRDQTKDQH